MKYGAICLEKYELMFHSLENQYSDTYLRSFHYIYIYIYRERERERERESGNLQPATDNYTMNLAFQQTKYWGLLFLHIGNMVVKFLPGPSIIKVDLTSINECLPNYLIFIPYFQYARIATLNTLPTGKLP